MRLKLSFLFCLSLFSGTALISQVTLTYEHIFEIEARKDVESLEFIYFIPEDIPSCQEILSINYSHEPVISIDDAGNRFASFLIDDPRASQEITIALEVEVQKYDLSKAAEYTSARPLESTERLNSYLQLEVFGQDTVELIQAIAAEIPDTSDLVQVYTLYDAITKLEFPPRMGMFEKADFRSLVFINALRVIGIPARIRDGVLRPLSHPRSEIDAKGQMAEAYLNGLGWVPFNTVEHWKDDVLEFNKIGIEFVYHPDGFYSYRGKSERVDNEGALTVYHEVLVQDVCWERIERLRFFARQNRQKELIKVSEEMHNGNCRSHYSFLLQGLSYLRLKEYEKSKAALQKAKEKAYTKRERYNSHVALARFYAIQEKNEEAIECLFRAMEVDVHFALADRYCFDPDFDMLWDLDEFERFCNE